MIISHIIIITAICIAASEKKIRGKFHVKSSALKYVKFDAKQETAPSARHSHSTTH